MYKVSWLLNNDVPIYIYLVVTTYLFIRYLPIMLCHAT